MVPRRSIPRLLSVCACALLVFGFAWISPILTAQEETPAVPESAQQPSLFDDALQTPAPVPMAPPCSSCVGGFTSSPGGGAASHWGFGSDCTAATSNLRSQLSNYANSVCAVEGDYGRCAFSVIHTSSCFYNPSYGLYQIDGYTNFSCWISWC